MVNSGRSLLKPFSLLATALVFLAAPVGADSIREVALPANDLVYDPASGYLLASVPGRAGERGNSITRIDPVTGEIVDSVYVGSEPGSLALTDDGRSLYVALNGATAVRRYDVSTHTAGLQFPVNGGVTRLSAIPGDPHSVGVLSTSLYNRSLSVYTDGVTRDSQFTYPDGMFSDILTSLSPSRLYAVDGNTLSRIDVGSQRVQNVDSWQQRFTGVGSLRNQFQRGLVFGSNGAVVDPEAGQLLGTLDTSGSNYSHAEVCPDLPGGRVYFLVTTPQSYEIRAYDARNYTWIGSTPATFLPWDFGSFIRWGTDGLAYRSGDKVYLVRTSLVSQDTPGIDLQVTGSEIPTLPAGDLLTYTLTVRNSGDNSATFATLTDTLPETATIESVTATQGAVYVAGKVVTARLGDLPGGASATVTVSVRLAVAGETSHQASVTAFETDMDSSNDRLVSTVSVGSPAIAELNSEWSSAKLKCPPRGKCQFTGKLVVRNQGGQDARKFKVRFLRSQTPYLTSSYAQLAEVKVARLRGGKSTVVKLNAKSYTTGGYYYVIAVVDPDGAVAEANENDNQSASGNLDPNAGASH